MDRWPPKLFLYFIRQDGTLWAWGANNFGQVNDNINIPQYSPVNVSFPKPAWMINLPKS
ncbi:hypothetical protein [Paenibacillus sp. LjRoot56]|uniref:hypothetical protein n=1 Tax=Paenibacillus sp. LjRoot56 TaxID=3342333 RepID=UPI003F508F4E